MRTDRAGGQLAISRFEIRTTTGVQHGGADIVPPTDEQVLTGAGNTIMRELTIFTNQQQAERLAGYLVTQSIPSSVDKEDGQWVIWVVNDDDRDAALKILDVFQQNPDDSRYDAALVQAKKLAKQEADVRRKYANVRLIWQNAGAVTGGMPIQ